jgi:hypothetical protein
MLSRPDLVWYEGVQPHCLHDGLLSDGGTTVIHRGPVRWNSTLEWLLLMPRRHAASILTTASAFDSCARGEPCCAVSRSEELLSYALSRVGRWTHVPFGVEILRSAQHAAIRNAGCMQPEALGFGSFELCRAVVYGLPLAQARAALAHRKRLLPTPGHKAPQPPATAQPPHTLRTAAPAVAHAAHGHARRDHAGHRVVG